MSTTSFLGTVVPRKLTAGKEVHMRSCLPAATQHAQSHAVQGVQALKNCRISNHDGNWQITNQLSGGLYSTEPRIEHAGAFLRESRPREIALSLLRARRFPRNLGFTNQLGTVDEFFLHSAIDGRPSQPTSRARTEIDSVRRHS